MKKLYTLKFLSTFIFYSKSLLAQRIYNGEPVQVVGSFNGYNTAPYGTDYRTTNYRVLSTLMPTTTASGNATDGPTDGRGHWKTTIQIPNGDAQAINMTGGGGNGFLFITGPSGNRFQNKWVFNGVGQAALDGINDCAFSGTTDMGLDLSATAYYTFVFNDCGYTSNNAKFYVGKTSTIPVTLIRLSETINPDSTATIVIKTSAIPSVEENVFIRYVDSVQADFSGTSTTHIVQATGGDSIFTATIKMNPASITTAKYYLFTSTKTLAQINAATEMDKSIVVLNYDDNNHSNYTLDFTLATTCKSFTATLKDNFVNLNWQTCNGVNVKSFEVEKVIDNNWKKIAVLAGISNTNNYSFKDISLLNNNLYRIKFIDANGKFSYSNIVIISKNSQVGEFVVYPTLVTDNNINIKTKEKTATTITIAIIDISGKLIQQKSFGVSEGETTIPYQIPVLKTGIYFVYLMSNNTKQTFRILVK